MQVRKLGRLSFSVGAGTWTRRIGVTRWISCISSEFARKRLVYEGFHRHKTVTKEMKTLSPQGAMLHRVPSTYGTSQYWKPLRSVTPVSCRSLTLVRRKLSQLCQRVTALAQSVTKGSLGLKQPAYSR